MVKLDWYEPSRTLRSANQGLLTVPHTTYVTKGDRAFQAVAPSLWNALPQDLRSAASVGIFKNQQKTFCLGMLLLILGIDFVLPVLCLFLC